jgi:hypothetical protein
MPFPGHVLALNVFELHDVQAALAKRGADGRRGIGAPAGTCNLM